MSKSTKIDIKQRLVNATLKLAEQGLWVTSNLAAVAKSADTPLSEVFAVARSKTELIGFIDADLTQRVLEEIGDIPDDMSTRDALFDLIMTRFELMKAKRKAYVELNAAVSKDLNQTVTCLGMSKNSITMMAELAHIDTSGIKGYAKSTALTYLYLNVFSTWLKDETDDLSITMKKLDTELAKAESWALEIQNFDLSSVFKPSSKFEAGKTG